MVTHRRVVAAGAVAIVVVALAVALATSGSPDADVAVGGESDDEHGSEHIEVDPSVFPQRTGVAAAAVDAGAFVYGGVYSPSDAFRYSNDASITSVDGSQVPVAAPPFPPLADAEAAASPDGTSVVLIGRACAEATPGDSIVVCSPNDLVVARYEPAESSWETFEAPVALADSEYANLVGVSETNDIVLRVTAADRESESLWVLASDQADSQWRSVPTAPGRPKGYCIDGAGIYSVTFQFRNMDRLLDEDPRIASPGVSTEPYLGDISDGYVNATASRLDLSGSSDWTQVGPAEDATVFASTPRLTCAGAGKLLITEGTTLVSSLVLNVADGTWANLPKAEIGVPTTFSAANGVASFFAAGGEPSGRIDLTSLEWQVLGSVGEAGTLLGGAVTNSDGTWGWVSSPATEEMADVVPLP